MKRNHLKLFAKWKIYAKFSRWLYMCIYLKTIFTTFFCRKVWAQKSHAIRICNHHWSIRHWNCKCYVGFLFIFILIIDVFIRFYIIYNKINSDNRSTRRYMFESVIIKNQWTIACSSKGNTNTDLKGIVPPSKLLDTDDIVRKSNLEMLP